MKVYELINFRKKYFPQYHYNCYTCRKGICLNHSFKRINRKRISCLSIEYQKELVEYIKELDDHMITLLREGEEIKYFKYR